MLADTLEHVDEIVVRIDLVQPTGRNQALDDADVLGAELGPAEHPIFPIMPTFNEESLLPGGRGARRPGGVMPLSRDR
jgi:hypothetical protein